MPKLSLLICSRNDVDLLLDLINDTYKVVDEIVVIDASGPKDTSRLKKMKAELSKKKTRVFFNVATMFCDPMREYGRSKCSGEWMMFVDTDERLNAELKRDVKKIIAGTDCNGFWFSRHEYQESSNKPTFVSRTLRLHRRNKAHYRGDPHDFPAVEGKIGDLPPKYYLKHMIAEFKTEDFLVKDLIRGVKLESYVRRQSYDILLDRLRGRPALQKLAGIYLSLKGIRDRKRELSRFDYNFALSINSMTWLPRIVRTQGLRSYFDILASNRKYEKAKLDFFFSLPAKEQRHQFDVSADIYWAGGLTKYLSLDKETRVRMWNRRYAYVKNERPVLFDMLDYEYKKRHPKGI